MLELTLSRGRGYGKLRLQRVAFSMDNGMGKNPCDNLINRGFTLIGWLHVPMWWRNSRSFVDSL